MTLMLCHYKPDEEIQPLVCTPLAFEKIQHPLMIKEKTLNKLGKGENYLDIIKGKYTDPHSEHDTQY